MHVEKCHGRVLIEEEVAIDVVAVLGTRAESSGKCPSEHVLGRAMSSADAESLRFAPDVVADDGCRRRQSAARSLPGAPAGAMVLCMW